MPRTARQARSAAARVGESMLAVRDRDELTVALLIGLGPPHMQQQPGGCVLDVGQRERDDLQASQAEA